MTLQNPSKRQQQFDLRKGLSFYDWLLDGSLNSNRDKCPILHHGNIINHSIGLPQKNGLSYPLFDYEQLVFEQQTHLVNEGNRPSIQEFHVCRTLYIT
ncbi:MAG: hypothetical protein ACM3X1_05745 [Ignavibacteriales bacterium]